MSEDAPEAVTPETVACPECGTPTTGNFCAQCGTPVRARFCNACGEKTAVGDHFCTSCGARLAGAPPMPAGAGAGAGPPVAASSSGRRTTPAAQPAAVGGGRLTPPVTGERQQWLTWVMLALLVGGALIVYGVTTRGSGGAVTGAAGAPAAGPLGASSVDLSSMTPREAADRLFDRVVRAAEQGDSAQMLQFLPMSISAYEVAEPLDDDGYFHKSILQRLAGDTEGAIASAEVALARSPGHLLALATAAEAAREAGDLDRARAYYRRFVDAYDAEVAKSLEEYQAHSALLPGMKEDAEEVLGTIPG